MTLTYSLVLMLAILTAAGDSIGVRRNSTLCTGSSYTSTCSGHQLSCGLRGFIVLMNAQNRFMSLDHECAGNDSPTCERHQQCCRHSNGFYCEEQIGFSDMNSLSQNCIFKRSCSMRYSTPRNDSCRLQWPGQNFEDYVYISEVFYTCVADNAVLTTTGPSSTIDHVGLATLLWKHDLLLDDRQNHYGTCYVNTSSEARLVRLYSLAFRGEYYNTYSNNYNWSVTVEDASDRIHEFNTTNKDADSWNHSVAHVIDTLQLPVTVRVKVGYKYNFPSMLWIGFEAECGTISMKCEGDDANSYPPFQVPSFNQSGAPSWHKIVQCQNGTGDGISMDYTTVTTATTDYGTSATTSKDYSTDATTTTDYSTDATTSKDYSTDATTTTDYSTDATTSKDYSTSATTTTDYSTSATTTTDYSTRATTSMDYSTRATTSKDYSTSSTISMDSGTGATTSMDYGTGSDSQQQQHHGSRPYHTGVVVGVTMGVLAVIAIAVIVGVVVYRRRSGTRKESRLESDDQVYHVPVTDTSSSTPVVWNPGYRGKTPGHKCLRGKKAARTGKGGGEENIVSHNLKFSADGKKPVPHQEENIYLELLDDQYDNLATVTLPQDARNPAVLGPSRRSVSNSDRGPLPPLPPSGVNPGSKQQTTSANLPTSTSPPPGHYASAPVPSVHGQTQQKTAPRDQAYLMAGPMGDQPQQRAASYNHKSTSEPKPRVTNPDYDYLPPSYDVLDARPLPPEYSRLSSGLQQRENPVTPSMF